MSILISVIAILGLAIGSFLNVVIYRVPRKESLVSPGSHCPNCNMPVRARHNVPVVSWLVLRGRCADCEHPIGLRYPLVELITAALFVAITIQLAHLHHLPALPAYLFFIAVGIALAAIDLDVMRIPSVIVYPAYVAVAALLGLAAVLDGSISPLIRAAIGSGAMFAFYFALAVAHPRGMGLGDVKLAGVIGAVLGFLSYPALMVGAFAAFAIGSLIAAALLVVRQANRKTLIPFGPSMLSGALLAIFASAPLAHAYSQLFQRV